MSSKLIFAINELTRVKPGTNGVIETLPAGEVFEGSSDFFKIMQTHNAVREPSEAEVALYERKKAAGELSTQESVIPPGGATGTPAKPLTEAQRKKAEKEAAEAETARLKAEKDAADKAEKDRIAAEKAAAEGNDVL